MSEETQIVPVVNLIKKAIEAEKTGKTAIEEAKATKKMMEKQGFDTSPADEKIAELESATYVGDDLVNDLIEDFGAVTSWDEFKTVISGCHKLLFGSNGKTTKKNGNGKQVIGGVDVAYWCIEQGHGLEVANMIAGTLGCGTSIMKTKYLNPNSDLYCSDRELPDNFRKEIEEAYEKISTLV